MKKLLPIITDWYFAILSAAVTLYFLLMLIFGGYIHSEIYWHTLPDLVNKLKK